MDSLGTLQSASDGRDGDGPARRATRPELRENVIFWRVEGSLLNLTAVRPVAFFAWNAQSFLERWARRSGMFALALARPVLYLTNRAFATRLLHTVLRGVSRDRLDLLGEEYFQNLLQPTLKQRGVDALKEAQARGQQVVLVSQGLDHVMRPLAQHLGVELLVSNRLEFREGFATGRLLDPVIRPRGPLARLIGSNPDGSVGRKLLVKNLGFGARTEILDEAVLSAARPDPRNYLRVIYQPSDTKLVGLSVRQSLKRKQILLAGVTGFIGKVWLANLLTDVPEIGKVYVLVRRRRSVTAAERFRKIVDESPVFGPLAEKHGAQWDKFLAERVEVLDGDLSVLDQGLDKTVRARLSRSLDLVINSSGLTDFNPDLRDALAANVDSVAHLIDFIRQSDHAALLHLSTCYVAGERDGRITETLLPNYTPTNDPEFEAEKEWQALRALIRHSEAQAESGNITDELRRAAFEKPTAAKSLAGAALDNQIRKNRTRWLRQTLTDAGTRRARELGWPNTYTLTKGISESLIAKRGAGLPIAIARPSIVESSVEKPFCGWNEGINTSASLSYLLGTYFRQLPTNERKCLDIIPVDQVTRGMTLIAAALIERKHEPLYQLATSVTNPCNMGRSIELTSLAHRKFYRTQNGFEHWLRSRFDAIPVSKARYETLSAPAQKAIVQAINRGVSSVGFNRSPLARRERELERVIKLVNLFEPFILRHEHTFEAMNIEKLSAILPLEEKQVFGFDSRSIDWWDYWINVHIPALRKWCYPLIEGRPVETRNREETPRPDQPVIGAATGPTASAATS
ncbi:MAG TPA: SDR family oxidoreductase [Candidatus Acidoferrales bacterium]|nr:SDR family oxidoreductase [Candidatus Acidoferrales bacterium]